MAHFLEHLVFKGGQKYDDYRKVNETAERMGAVLNAYTSHDLVAFHITCRAEVVGEAIDLLTDFVGRPKVDQEELDRERGVVIQEIARANDQPSVVAEHLIDRAAFGDHPLGRPVLGPEEHLRNVHARRDRRVPPPPVGGRARRRVPGRQPRARARRTGAGRDVRPLPVDPGQRQLRARARRSRRRRWSRSATPTSRTCASPTGRDRPGDQRQRAALAVYSTLLGGSMGSRLFDEIREQRGLAYSVYSVDHCSPTCRSCSSPRASSPGSASRPTRACARSSTSCARTGRARRSSSAPGLRRRPPRAGVREHQRGRPPRRAQTVVLGQEIDPDAAIAALDETTFDDVTEVAQRHLGGRVGGLRRARTRRPSSRRLGSAVRRSRFDPHAAAAVRGSAPRHGELGCDLASRSRRARRARRCSAAPPAQGRRGPAARDQRLPRPPRAADAGHHPPAGAGGPPAPPRRRRVPSPRRPRAAREPATRRRLRRAT